MTFERYFSKASWEKKIGYCRAVRAGNLVYVTGTVAIDDNGLPFAKDDAYAQAKRCFSLIEKSLRAFGGDLSRVTRTRMFVTDISQWEKFGKAHQEAFGAHPPATTMVEVAKLIAPGFLIEVEADAFLE